MSHEASVKETANVLIEVEIFGGFYWCGRRTGDVRGTERAPCRSASGTDSRVPCWRQTTCPVVMETQRNWRFRPCQRHRRCVSWLQLSKTQNGVVVWSLVLSFCDSFCLWAGWLMNALTDVNQTW